MLREWNQLPDAEHHLLQGLAWSRGRMMDAETLSLGYSALARVYTAQGRFDQAEAVLLECAQVGEDRNFVPHLTARLGAERARVALLQGDLEAAHVWAEMVDRSGTVPPSYPANENISSWPVSESRRGA